MSNDLVAARSELQYEILRMRTNLDALLLRGDLPNREQVEWSAHLLDVIEDCLDKSLLRPN